MDVVEFRMCLTDFGADEDHPGIGADIFVNGESLWSAIEAALGDTTEDEDDTTPALPPSLVVPPSRHWLGDPHPDWSEGSDAFIFNCECGYPPCGGTLARITASDDTVTWSRIKGPGDLAPLPIGPFTFDRGQYEEALAQLARDSRL